MQQRKALLALVMLLALLTFNTEEVQAKGGRGGGGSRSSGHRSSSSGGGFFSGWGKKSKSSSSSDSSSGGGGGGFFSFGSKSKSSSSSSSHKNSDSHSSHHSTGQNGGKAAPPIGWNVGSDNSHLHKPIKPSKVGNHHSKPTHHHHVASYPKQPVFMTSRIPGAPPPPPPPYGGYYASSSSLPVGAVYYPQVPRTSSDPGFTNGFFAGAYGQSILHRLSHVHYYGGHSSVIHRHNNQNQIDNNNNNGGSKDTIIIINNNPATTGDLEQANTTTTPQELGTQLTPIQPVLTNDLANATGAIFEANITNLTGPTDAAAMPAMPTTIINDDVPDGNATTTLDTTLSDNMSIAAAASNDVDHLIVDNNQTTIDNQTTINTIAPPTPGGIICFPSMVNETDAQDPSKVLQVEKIFCFPAEPPEPTVEELRTQQQEQEQQQQPPEQPNILNEVQSTLSGANKKGGSFQFAGVMVLLYLSIYYKSRTSNGQ